MVRHTLKILQHLLQDFYIVSDHFGIIYDIIRIITLINLLLYNTNRLVMFQQLSKHFPITLRIYDNL